MIKNILALLFFVATAQVASARTSVVPEASGNCKIEMIDSNNQLKLVGNINLISLNPDGHYGVLMNGGGYQFIVKVMTSICLPDKGCNVSQAGTSAEKITLYIHHLGDGASSTQIISGRAFAFGDSVASSLNISGTSINCIVQRNNLEGIR